MQPHTGGTIMTATRTESDSFGPLEVPADKYWGAQTQRSIMNFPIGWEKQPVAIVRALGVIKRACARPTRRRASWTRSWPTPSSRPRRR
jgi:fumarate hydratase class II